MQKLMSKSVMLKRLKEAEGYLNEKQWDQAHAVFATIRRQIQARLLMQQSMPEDALKVHEKVPFAGNGDHWFYEVAEGRDFTKDHRFERFNRGGMEMIFKGGIAYWHLKYLKVKVP